MTKNNLKIFIADTDNYWTFAYRQLLHVLGYKKIYTFRDTESCINNLVLKPDVLFLNFSLINFLGLDVLNKIKSIYPQIKVVFISEMDEMNSALASLKFGEYEFVVKGSDEEERIETMLDEISSNKVDENQKSSGPWQRVASLFL